ncbi:hypothetical protein [Pseudomonas sp. MAG002Y]|uniref:hypothetical protein n=1 Tax=Pseudomonas sp. MAG002Y TaxID=2678690 RepID=UPI001C610630|nr:hypothetical protein [Pseudomonas sp. MAG002Y]MBW5413579.1 hypothetical protein [Pseudomonas sp. MAG002Y]
MDSIGSGIQMRYQATSLDASQPLSPSSLQTEQTHPSALPLARLSRNALLALTQVEAQPDPHHQLFALLAYNGIADGALHIHSSKLTEAEYRQQVAVPNAGPANLTIQAKLNEHSQYDIVRITLDVLSTGGTESITLCAPAPPIRRIDPHPISDNLSAQGSRGQLTQALIRLRNPHHFRDGPISPAAASSTYSVAGANEELALSTETERPAISASSLYALHTNGTEAEVRFLRQPPKEVADMCMLIINVIGKSFPQDFNKIDFDFYDREGDMDRGVTNSNGNRSRISIGLIASEDWNQDFEMHAMIAFTVFHEIFLHALPDLRTASYGMNPTTAQQDHDIILIPPNESNLLHQAVKQILPQIPPHIKQYFLDSYVTDIEEEKDRNDHIDVPTTEQWYQLLNSQANDLDSPFWHA